MVFWKLFTLVNLLSFFISCMNRDLVYIKKYVLQMCIQKQTSQNEKKPNLLEYMFLQYFGNFWKMKLIHNRCSLIVDPLMSKPENVIFRID